MKKVFFALAALLLVACGNDDVVSPPETTPELPVSSVTEQLIICNEGNWQSDNGQLSLYDGSTNTVTNKWFRQMNGKKLGDTPNDIIQINDNLIAISVNWSNIIQYIRPDGTACGATENVPNNRRLCTDGSYLYVTSYAHICGEQTFEKGYVAKIDVETKQVVATCEVGWEPEGIRLYDGRLYIANSGGYSFSEVQHDYETTISVVDAASMRLLRSIDTGCINLYGEMSQAGKYLCINSCGDYYGTESKTIILDCETERVTVFGFPATCSTSDGTRFYTVGSSFSYDTYETVYSIRTIDPTTMQVSDGVFCETITQKLASLVAPYDIYLSPITGNVYFTDAKTYATAGYLYGYTQDGKQLFNPQKLYINPAHMLAIKQ